MDHAAVIVRLEQFEGNIPHMYKCTGGAITAGIGHTLPTSMDAMDLPWFIVPPNVPIADQVRRDYLAISAAPKGQPAADYAKLTRCRLTADAIQSIVEWDVRTTEALLVHSLPLWPRYPELARQALCDMAFNLGIIGLLKFRFLLNAVNAGNWNKASNTCHRKGIAEHRNWATAALFRQAGGVGS